MSDYRRVRAMFPDHLAIARGKYIPSHLAENGASFCITNFALTYDKDMYPTAVSRLLEGLPDLDLTYEMDDIRPCWLPNTDMVIGDVSFHGEPIQAAPRTVLKKAISDWKALGYDVRLGLETESFVLQPTEEGGWVEWDTPGAHVYGTGPFSDPIGLFDEIMETAYQVGLPIEAINTEYDSPSWEVTLEHADALTAVDNIFYLKLMMREIAFKHGLRLVQAAHMLVMETVAGPVSMSTCRLRRMGKTPFSTKRKRTVCLILPSGALRGKSRRWSRWRSFVHRPSTPTSASSPLS